MTTGIERLAAALADRYRIERELGAGGMATVYLAQDLKHDRKVAVKVLRPELAAVIGAERFLSEIKTTANLQHPHILPLFDSGEAGRQGSGEQTFLFYVMPYVEGESLRDRLTREKQLPIADAVRIAKEVASALDYAHRHGIIHRDIKPENVMLHDGSALVADFGIALAASKAGSTRMTETGMSLGTPSYMSPEQAMGEREITARSDVYALGAMVYEMLVGDPPFIGSTAQAIVAKVLTEKPTPPSALRETVPEAVEDAVLTALAKLPADRWSSAAAFAAALDGQRSGTPTTANHPRRTIGRPVVSGWNLGASWPWLAALVFAVIAALVGWLRPGSGPGMLRQQVMLWHVNLPQPLDPGARILASQAAIAPDGSSIVYSEPDGGFHLMRKLRDAAEATPIAGTEGAVSPFFSPDGRWIGYTTTDGLLRKVPVSGGGSITLAQDVATDYEVAAWLDDQTIVYADRRRWLSRVSADGPSGRPTPFHHVGNAGVATLWPLPGSRGVLLTVCNGNCAVYSYVAVYDFAADSARLLVPQAAGAWYSPTGHLLYTSRDGGLYAAAFDPRRLAIRSGSVPVIENVEPTRFTLSNAGTVLYSLDPVTRAGSGLVWVTREGRASPVDSTWQGRFEYPALSPDGSMIAVSLRGRTTDLWIRRASGTRQRVIAGGVANWRASWFPDRLSFAFVSVRSADTSSEDVVLYRARADGAGSPQLLLKYRLPLWESEVSGDGRWLVVRADESGHNRVFARRLDGDTALIPLVSGDENGVEVALSPDARWLAYTSTLADGNVVVASFPDMESKRQVSQGGGFEPRWARNGRELFFKSQGQMMAVSVAPGPGFNPGDSRPLFSLEGYRVARNRAQYDVAPDGRFLMIRETGSEAGVVYTEHWFDELEAKVHQ
ncbi:MAG: protein kinase [Gemmatimonadota bacterium]